MNTTDNTVTKTLLFSQTPDTNHPVIYRDDSIQTIKLKISKAIDGIDGDPSGGALFAPESMYLFARRFIDTQELTVERMYQEITLNDTRELTALRVQTYLDNHSIAMKAPTDGSPLDPFLETVQEHIHRSPIHGVLQYFPLGLQFNFRGKTDQDFTFPINPYHCHTTILDRLQEGGVVSTSLLVPADHHLLLRYAPLYQDELYVCLQPTMATHECSKYYFPRQLGSEAHTKKLVQQLGVKDPAVEYLYRIAQHPVDIPRLEKYIVSFTLVMMNRVRLPLEIIFKNLSATAATPAIMYNPGKNQENILRLYSVRTSRNGRRIPVLSKKEITDFAKFSKRQTIVFLLPRVTAAGGAGLGLEEMGGTIEGLGVDYELYVKINSLGEVYIHGEQRVASVTDLDEIVRAKVNPLLRDLNTFLGKSGYTLPLFEGVTSPQVGIKHFHERWVVPSRAASPAFSILQELPCIRDVFDVYDDVGGVGGMGGLGGSEGDDDTEEIVLRYKRMFSDIEGQGQLIREFRRRGKPEKQMVEALIVNYRMSFEQARRRVEKYQDEEEARFLARSSNRELFFPIQFHFDHQQIVVDIFKFCRDCGSGGGEVRGVNVHGIEEYTVGPKMRIQKQRARRPLPPGMGVTPGDIPRFAYMEVLELYVHSILQVVLGLGMVPVPPLCDKIRFEEEAPAPGMEEPDLALAAAEDQDYAAYQDEIIGVDTEHQDEEEPVEAEGEAPRTLAEEDMGSDEDSGSESEEESSDEEDAFLFGGAKLKKRYKTKLDRLKDADPKLFFTSKKGSTDKSYGRICQRDHQPIVLNQEEYETVTETHPTVPTIHYATTPTKKYWYACPKYWCSVTNQILTKEQYQAGVCKDHVEVSKYTRPSFEDSNKHPHPDGFCLPCCFKSNNTSKKLHIERIQKCQQEPTGPTGPTAPGASATSASLAFASPTGRVFREERNILKYTLTPPVTQGRWGLLPRSVQYFFNMDYTKMVVTTANSTKILPNHPCMLLYGIEHPRRQSFLGLFAEIYAYKHQLPAPLTVAEIRTILTERVTLDRFLQCHNGAFLSVFGTVEDPDDPDKEKGSALVETDMEVYRSIDPNHPVQVAFYRKATRAWRNFTAFLSDPQTPIDHVYLWELLAGDFPELIPGGCNLVILEFSPEEGTIDIVCPPGEVAMFDPRKETFFVLKRDQYYEPIYQYLDVDGKHITVTKGFFMAQTRPYSSMRRILEVVEVTQRTYCQPIRDPQETMVAGLSASQTRAILHKYNYTVHSQVWNTRAQVIGLYVSYDEEELMGVMVPCRPSGIFLGSDLPIVYLDSSGGVGTLWKPYLATVARLNQVWFDTNEEISCQPVHQVVDPSGGWVSGVQTETAQFVPTYPPIRPIEVGKGLSVKQGALPTVVRANEVKVDQILSLTPQEDPLRRTLVRNILLETQFYQVFRSTVRRLLNDYHHRESKRTLLAHIQEYEKGVREGHPGDHYSPPLMAISVLLQGLTQPRVEFVEYTSEELDDLVGKVAECGERGEGGEGEGGLGCEEGRLAVPRYHLLSDKEGSNSDSDSRLENLDRSNRNIYHLRLADELLRYPRIQWFMFQTRVFLNIASGTSDYHLSPREILVLESFLNDEYFRDMIPFNTSEYIHQTNYDTAEPATTATTGRVMAPTLTLEDQRAMIRQVPEDIQRDFVVSNCILKKKLKDNYVEGNDRSIWRRAFPKHTREIFFQGSPASCTFAVITNLLKMAGKGAPTVGEIKTMLWAAYRPYIDDPRLKDKLLWFLGEQNKKKLLERTDLETAIMTEEYFVSDLDLWVLATHLDLPVVLFSARKVKMVNEDHWLYLNTQVVRSMEDRRRTGTESDMVEDVSSIYRQLYFIRSPANLAEPTYSLIETAFTYQQLGEMANEFEDGIRRRSNQVISVERYLREKIRALTH